jgi:ABC-type Mn2+/Zn2+ transport system permease subunit
MDWLLEPFQSGIGRRALAEVLLLGLACGPLGVWVLLYRQAYAAESISHGMLPGLVLAALAGAPLLLGAAAGVLAAAGLVALAQRDPRISPDTAVALGVTTLFGLGALLALSPESPPRLEELLFGDLLGVTDAELVTAAVVVVLAGAVAAAAHRSLAVAAFDPGAARALGTRPGVSQLVVLVLLGAVTVVAVQGLGNLLVLALVVAPAAAALRRTRRLVGALALTAVLAMAAGVCGLLVSHHLEVAAGASVALCAVALFALSVLLPGGAGAARAVGGRLPTELLADR